MANTIQMFISGVALLVNSLLCLIMAFMSNLILAPIMGAFSKIVTGPQALPMSDMQYVIPYIWIVLVLMEIVCIISFFVVASRSNEVAYEQFY